MSLEQCLPPALRSPNTKVTPIGRGQSGAGVFRVDVAGETYVLKVAQEETPLSAWQQRVAIVRDAADAGIAPAVVHVDEERRAVLSAFVVDRSFPALFLTPATHERALALLADALRRVHQLPLGSADGVASPDARAMLANLVAGLRAANLTPAFVFEAADRVLGATEPPRDRPLALCHNDVNPANLAFDGERLYLLDWDVAGPNDPLYDVATVALFLRMDDATSEKLIALHDDAAPRPLPERFRYLRRLVAAVCGAMFVQLAHKSGFAGARSDTPSLGEFFAQLRSGAVNMATPEGRWAFGVVLAKTSLEL